MKTLTARLCALVPMLLASPTFANWDVELDPAAFFMHGASLHVARESNRGNIRVQLGFTGFHVPDSYHDQEGFDLRNRSLSFKVDYFFAGQTQGFFAGLDSDYAERRYRSQITLESEERKRGSLGPRIGYRWEVGDYWYVTPWVSVNYIIDANDIVINEQTFEQDSYDIRPAIHVGWRF